MRRTSCLVLVGALVLVATAPLRAQHRVWPVGDDCGCNTCAATAMAGPCCAEPLIPSLLRGIHNTLGCLLCCPGLNARHDIYRAALNRNDFDKCGCPLLPIYVPRRCCGAAAAPDCPHCGHAHGVEGEIIETDEMPDEMLLEPTPATELEAPSARPAATPQLETRRRPSSAHVAVPTAANRDAALRDRTARAAAAEGMLRPTATSGPARRTSSTHQVQRAGLLDTFRP